MNSGTMGSLPLNVAVFFGKVDKRPSGWYWIGTEAEKAVRAPITGPFETKEAAIEDAARSEPQSLQ
jgi:hypothetical protein